MCKTDPVERDDLHDIVRGKLFERYVQFAVPTTVARIHLTVAQALFTTLLQP